VTGLLSLRSRQRTSPIYSAAGASLASTACAALGSAFRSVWSCRSAPPGDSFPVLFLLDWLASLLQLWVCCSAMAASKALLPWPVKTPSSVASKVVHSKCSMKYAWDSDKLYGARSLFRCLLVWLVRFSFSFVGCVRWGLDLLHVLSPAVRSSEFDSITVHHEPLNFLFWSCLCAFAVVQVFYPG
jgi:hypothetical protein